MGERVKQEVKEFSSRKTSSIPKPITTEVTVWPHIIAPAAHALKDCRFRNE